jgi:hypothetical protein
MINSFNSTDLLSDFEALPIEAIALEPNHIDQAVQLSSQIPSETRQWQTYLNALALFSFEQWLSERASEIPVNREHCSVLQPQYANVIEAVCNPRVGEFKVCLLTPGTLIDEVVVPRAAIDLPEYTAHFYVVLEVQEEQEQATVRGFLRHDQLVERLQSANLQAGQDWTYELPLAWFDHDPERLLLYLRCLDPTAIPLPAVPTDRLATLSGMQAELATLLPQLQSPDLPLWQVLTWEQGVALLTSPELLNWLYRLQTEQPDSQQASLTSQLSHLFHRLSQRIVNVRLWLQDELDEVAQSLSWILLPAPALATASLRSLSVSAGESPTEVFEAIITELRGMGMEIPPQARGAYRDLSLAEADLRLYAVTWPLPAPGISEWTLLLVLGAQPGSDLPFGLKLQVREMSAVSQDEPTSVLVERELEQNTDNTYLYTRVVGTWEEAFLVTIALGTGEALTLPPFSFVSE